MNSWQYSKPPHGILVEVMDGHHIIRVRAIWGDRDKGVLPHWESEDRNKLWAPDAFNCWREIE
jgi:hypothetical protein